jgi:hypothetical protein
MMYVSDGDRFYPRYALYSRTSEVDCQRKAKLHKSEWEPREYSPCSHSLLWTDERLAEQLCLSANKHARNSNRHPRRDEPE